MHLESCEESETQTADATMNEHSQKSETASGVDSKSTDEGKCTDEQRPRKHRWGNRWTTECDVGKYTIMIRTNQEVV
jgi:hypothetical protein